ncbi:hypothetical protein SBV1_360007 [Verrucomicrobia bacterium]|nr:hypothetical protein SBV1_360007 [Verrucomicrobiota bacterium]
MNVWRILTICCPLHGSTGGLSYVKTFMNAQPESGGGRRRYPAERRLQAAAPGQRPVSYHGLDRHRNIAMAGERNVYTRPAHFILQIESAQARHAHVQHHTRGRIRTPSSQELNR